MLAVISPAKTLDFECQLPAHRPTKPQYLDEADEIIGVLRKKSRPQLQELMKLSENLAELNFVRYKEWNPDPSEDTSRAALFAFRGDVYTGFELDTYGTDDLKYAQSHLRILSGLYGILRPLDRIQPYRLEMGTALKTAKGKNLYEYWGEQLTDGLRRSIKKSDTNFLVNLASNEYFSAISPDRLDTEIITPQFKQLKNGSYKFLSFYGKKARGMMSDFMIRERIDTPEGLKDFSREGYSFNQSLSEGNNWVFTRDEVPAKA
ncbi:MAG: peroxide stress protein YaaA [Verrucomicrobiales bacterium]|nr:peroxide stress protein YaaA [Verrucomicrobiales bacterium]